MDPPQIRFTKTEDGKNIAYATVGDGPPIVRALGWFTHVEMEWSQPVGRYFWEALARGYTLTRYDGRGIGLSDREVEHFSLETRISDLDAVINAVSPDAPVTIMGLSEGGATAVAYAARQPQRVRALILYGSFDRFGFHETRSPGAQAQQEAMVTLVERGWGLENASFRQLFTSAQMPSGTPEQIDYFNALQSASATRETAARFLQSVYAIDVRAEADRVRAPTLVLHRQHDQIAPFGWGRRLAARIRGARLIPLQGDNHQIWVGNEPEVTTVISAIEEFVPPRAEAAGLFVDAPEQRGAIHTIVFTDLAASTAITQRLGDAAAQDLIHTHNEIVRAALVAHSGHEVKHTGDGIFASFPAASNALDCAKAIQQGVTDIANPDLGVKIGLNAGEPIAEEDDLYGTAVQIAARVTDQAAAGEIVCTDVVRLLVAGKAYLFSEREPAALKGVEEPVRLFTLGLG